MAHVTSREFDTLIQLLTEQYGLGALHTRLLKANALVSHKRPHAGSPWPISSTSSAPACGASTLPGMP